MAASYFFTTFVYTKTESLFAAEDAIVPPNVDVLCSSLNVYDVSM